jgi:deoxyribodipyrimidine photo-lyase
MSLHVVWFKRDLRVQDHAPLVHACRSGQTVGLYIWEPGLMAAPDYAAQHAAFIRECLTELRDALHELGIPLLVRNGEAQDVLGQLHQEAGIAALHSHEETGNALSYARDLRVAAWCKEHSVMWLEQPSNAVVRRLKNRDGWSSIWLKRMSCTPLAAPQLSGVSTMTAAIDVAPRWTTPQGQDKPLRQRGGRAPAIALLESFMQGRGDDYRAAMSSPLSSQDACSRLSPYIAYGVLSIREVVHRLWQARQTELGVPLQARRSGWLASLKSFESRLHWHCHFIQKLESDPSIEIRNLHRAYDGLREPAANPALHGAWCSGETGVPMVDACMRMLHATGWINFRMRAMLVSFASYQLWQPWQPTALHLAREFLDYEPGIHYPQVQMQSGTTGINTIRMYNPVKQARDHDPAGVFVRRWIPQLARVPDQFVFEPWKMPDSLQREAGCALDRDYPRPVIDIEQAARQAREAIWAVRNGRQFKQDAQKIYQKHGSRNPTRESGRRRQAPRDKDQLTLEF